LHANHLPKNDYDSPLLTEIRENFDYLEQQWAPIYDEGDVDMRYISGDPWDPKERRARQNADRLILTFDEINQYVNQVVNNYRQNPRSVRVVPKGLGATADTAEKRGDMMREIEYKSKAQAAIRTAFEGAVQRGFGFYKFKTAYVSDSSWDQEVRYVRVPNPRTILIDWDTREADCSDMAYAFEFDTMPKKAYRRKYQGAQYQFFSSEFTRIAPAWVKADRVMVASYWKLTRDQDVLFHFENGADEKLSVFQERYGKKNVKVGGNYIDLGDGQDPLIFLKRRNTENRTVRQYLTNGVEILEEHIWPGTHIPIIPVLGRELWVDDGGGAMRKLLSLVRLARSPYMAYCYIRTCQIEIAQQSPKAMFAGFVGQFDTSTDFKNVHKVPTAFVEFNLTTDQSMEAAQENGAASPQLPVPQRITFDAAGIQALEISAEACRRAIQSAMNITGLLNGTSDSDAKSGIALQTLDAQESTGNFHFIDNLDIALENGGRQLNELLSPVYDGTRQVGMRTLAGEQRQETINALDAAGNPTGFHTDVGDHDVDISTGPSAVNQAMAAADFAEQLMKEPAFAGKVMDLIIKLRNLGPLGDEMAKRFAPDPNGIPPAIAQQIQELQQMVNQLQAERIRETTKVQGQLQKANMDQQTQLQKQRMSTMGVIATALIKAGYAAEEAQVERMLTAAMSAWDKAHEGLMLDAEAARDRDMAQMAHQQTLERQAAAPPQPAPQPVPA